MSRIPVLKTYKNLVNGEFVRTESGRYYKVTGKKGQFTADVCLSSRKDARSAVVAARNAQHAWAGRSAYNRSQVIYRIAEMLETRTAPFIEELTLLGFTAKAAEAEVQEAIERIVYYAGWADKFTQVFSSVNPVASKHFNFSVPEATGVVAAFAPEDHPLTAFLDQVLPVITGGNTVVAIPSSAHPLSALSLGEVFATSDVPAGVVNILSGTRSELLPVLASHMDVNALLLPDDLSEAEFKLASDQASLNVKRVREYAAKGKPGPYRIMDFQEIKTTWHPIGF